MKDESRKLTDEQRNELLIILKERFEKNIKRHKEFYWERIAQRFVANPEKLWSLYQMEATGGEPDVILYDNSSDEYLSFDCCAESPKGRRSICYDPEALNSRKENKPHNSAVGMAAEMGIELLTEEQYRLLQTYGSFDNKSSSWIKTPDKIRMLGGALFCDRRYDTVFVYHNGAESYYASRGFRGMLRV